MSEIAIRPYAAGDEEGFRHVRSIVYRNGEAVPADATLLRSDCKAYVGETGGDVVASTTVLDMTATKHGSAIRCGGIAAVGVLPEKRRSGIGSAMMSRILPMMRDDGFALASLYPFSAAYYRRFGYEYCGTRYAVKCPSHRLPKLPLELEPRLLPSGSEAIAECFRKFAHRYAGMNLRSADQWWRALGGDNPFNVYGVGDPIEGYIAVRLNSDFWNEQSIREIVWTTDRAYRSLLTLIGSLAMNKAAMDWREPGDSPFYARYLDQGVELSLEHNIMFRVIDVPSTLAAVRSGSDGEFCFGVDDVDIPDNRGPWRVCFDGSSTHVERVAHSNFTLPVGALTQAFLGEPSFEAVLRSGVVRVSSEKGVAQAIRFFGSDRVYCADYF